MSRNNKKRLRSLLGRAARRFGRAGSSREPSPNAPIDEEALVVFRDANGTVLGSTRARTGRSLLSVAREVGIDIDSFCGGQCSCGTCRVKVLNGENNLSKISGPEQMVLGPKHLAECGRLSCQAAISGDVEIEVPAWF